MHALALEKTGLAKSGRFAKRTQRSPQVEPDANLADRTQADLAKGSAGQNQLEAATARADGVSIVVEYLRHNHFRHFAQTKPTGKSQRKQRSKMNNTRRLEAGARRNRRILVDRFHETNRIGRMEIKPTDLILRRREAPSRRMAAGSVSLVAVLRDARTAVKLAQTA
jgi:hypothetical protein